MLWRLSLRIRSRFASNVAIVHGNLPNDRGVIEAPIGRSDKDRKKQAVTAKGKPAVTRFTVLERFWQLYLGRVAAGNRSYAPDSCAHGLYWSPCGRRPSLWATQDTQGPWPISTC